MEQVNNGISIQMATMKNLVPPEDFNDEMIEEFRKMGKILIEAKVLSTLDIPFLIQFIDVQFQLRKINKLMRDTDNVSELKSLNTIAGRLSNNFIQLGKNLGVGCTNKTCLEEIYDSMFEKAKEKAISDLMDALEEGRISESVFKKKISKIERGDF